MGFPEPQAVNKNLHFTSFCMARSTFMNLYRSCREIILCSACTASTAQPITASNSYKAPLVKCSIVSMHQHGNERLRGTGLAWPHGPFSVENNLSFSCISGCRRTPLALRTTTTGSSQASPHGHRWV